MDCPCDYCISLAVCKGKEKIKCSDLYKYFYLYHGSFVDVTNPYMVLTILSKFPNLKTIFVKSFATYNIDKLKIICEKSKL